MKTALTEPMITGEAKYVVFVSTNDSGSRGL